MGKVQKYSIQQVADLTKLSAHTLRYYEKIGLIAPVNRHENGHRCYQDEDLGLIHFIKLLRATGMPVQEMTDFMRLIRQGNGTIPNRLIILKEHRTQLCEHINMLQNDLDHLDRKIAVYDALVSDNPTSITCED